MLEILTPLKGSTVYLVSAFSPSMLDLPIVGETKNYVMSITGLEHNEFCKEISKVSVNAIGHQGTADMINTLCGTTLKANRVEVKVNSGDTLLLIQLLTRSPEGKVYTKEELLQLLNQGKIRFYKITVYW